MLNTPLGKRIKALIDSNDFPYGPFIGPWYPDRVRRLLKLRQLGRRCMRRREVRRRGLLAMWVSSLLWPVLAFWKAWQEGANDARRGLPSQFWLRWWLQLVWNLRIAEQVYLGAAVPANRVRVGLYITDGEHKALMEHMNKGASGASIGSKTGFAAFCQKHGLPAPVELVEGGGGRPSRHLVSSVPSEDLFAKQANAWGGSRALKLPRHGTGWLAPSGEVLSWEVIPQWLDTYYEGAPWVLQECLRNADSWSQWSTGALSTLRIVTARRSPEAEVELLCSFVRFPRQGADVDNLSSGGIGGLVDVRTGVISDTRCLDSEVPRFPVHPDTGAQIEGVLLPDWELLCALAVRAHSQVPDLATVGWDLASTRAGALLVEANPNWGVPLELFLGETAYVEVLEHASWADRLE